MFFFDADIQKLERFIWAVTTYTLCMLCVPGSSAAKSVKWDTQADWSKGSAQKVTWTKNPGEIKLIFDPASVKQTPFIYLPNSGLNTIVQMDTRTGQINWTFNLAVLNLGSSPSRTTVDTKGNVWIGLRSGNHVVALSPQGKFLASVNVGQGPRAVTIDRNGDIWAAGYNAKSITKISGKTFKVLKVIRDNRICAYGAATDSIGNVWTMNRCHGTITKISVATGTIVGNYSAYNGYGIAADKVGHVWVASYLGAAAYQYNAATGVQIKSYPLGARGRGISVDSSNRVWVACSTSSSGSNIRHVNRIHPTSGQVDTFTNVGLHTIGVAIDSHGFAWANSYTEGKAYKLNVNTGAFVASYNICDTTGTRPCANTGCRACANTNLSQPYTYSDMTGFQLQLSPAQGSWSVVFDAKCKASFSNVQWQGSLPSKTRTRVRARTASTAAGLSSSTWGPYVTKGQALQVPHNRFIQVQFFLETPDSRISPTVTEASLNFDHFKEVCDGIDNDCDGQTDEDFPNLGQVCHNGKGICKRTSAFACHPSRTKTHCPVQPGTPQQEICDNKDNNCNGLVDETWPQQNKACQVGVGECARSGTLICSNGSLSCSVSPSPPKPEICDGKDNNCNGQTDELLTRRCTTACGVGKRVCKGGKWETCDAPGPKTETCNDADDDCDGQVDENLFRECKTICGKGKEQCKRGKWLFCTAQKATTEVCDGKDNDCNGKIDDAIAPKKCSGACGQGTAICQGGKWSGCVGPQPKQEVCDGKDNDCDGVVDQFTRPCRSACGSGLELCRNGVWVLCSAPSPQPELCDGKDNDCDGILDNKASCPKGMKCLDGECKLSCFKGECSRGGTCINDICEGDLCASIKCPKGRICQSGRCIDPCAQVKCPAKHVCEAGKCIPDDCYRKGCPAKQQCVQGECITDPCLSISCSKGQFCREGKCVNSCVDIQCKGRDKCVNGVCVRDPKHSGPCENIECPEGQFCKAGKCVGDPCYNVQCPKGRACVVGVCDHDPCLNIRCPNGQVCREGQCHKGSTSSEPTTPDGNTADGGTSTPEKTHPELSQPDGSSPEVKKNVDTSATKDTKNTTTKHGGKHPDKDGSGKRYASGCGCDTRNQSFPVSLLLACIVLIGVRRKKK